MSEPIWEDGEPANIEAALADAYEWLAVLRKVGAMRSVPNLDVDAMQRLSRCMDSLRKFVDG